MIEPPVTLITPPAEGSQPPVTPLPIPDEIDEQGAYWGWPEELTVGAHLSTAADPRTFVVSVGMDSGTELDTSDGRLLATRLIAACAAANGAPVRWRQLRALAAPPGHEGPVEPGVDGVAVTPATFRADRIKTYQEERTGQGWTVLVQERILTAIGDVTRLDQLLWIAASV